MTFAALQYMMLRCTLSGEKACGNRAEPRGFRLSGSQDDAS